VIRKRDKLLTGLKLGLEATKATSGTISGSIGMGFKNVVQRTVTTIKEG
jgi:hypothetical protein